MKKRLVLTAMLGVVLALGTIVMSCGDKDSGDPTSPGNTDPGNTGPSKWIAVADSSQKIAVSTDGGETWTVKPTNFYASGGIAYGE
jgi:hypothetical protein